MKKKLLTLLILFGVQVVISQNYNRPVPPALFPFEFISHSPTTGYYFTVPLKLFSDVNDPDFKSPCPTILNSDGYVTWYLDNEAGNNGDFKYFPNDSVLTFTRSQIGDAWYFIMDLDLNIIDSITNVNGTTGDGHEFLILSNGNYLIGAADTTIMDLSAYTFNGTQGSTTTTVKSYVLQEFDSNHNLVFEWNSIDHIFPTETYDIYGYNVNGFDYAHGNAIEEDVDGNILVSFRHLNSVYKIDHSTGNVIWRLGGESSDFTFTNDIGFSGQHHCRLLPNGNITLFDNANSAPPPKKSRGVEYALDTINWTATRTWEYIHTPSFFARAMGNHQHTITDDHLINYGWNYRPNPSFVHTNNSGDLISEVYYKDSVVNYRSFIYDVPFTFQQPEITCTNNGTNIELFAPSGFNSYIWSTGETTSSIIVTNADTFQVWVDHGVGMLGSLPVFITDPQTYCLSGIEPENTGTEILLIKYIDLLGREVIYPIDGQMYIAVYSNGKKELKYINK